MPITANCRNGYFFVAARPKSSAHIPPAICRRLEFLVNTQPFGSLYALHEAGGDFRATASSAKASNRCGATSAKNSWPTASFWRRSLASRRRRLGFCRRLQHLTQADEHSPRIPFSHQERRIPLGARAELRMLLRPAGNALEIVGHCFDITERKLAEAALREKRSPPQTDLQSAPPICRFFSEVAKPG